MTSYVIIREDDSRIQKLCISTSDNSKEAAMQVYRDRFSKLYPGGVDAVPED